MLRKWLTFLSADYRPSKSIEEDIARGITIICDRYVYSGMIYSAAKRLSNLSLGWARECDVGLPRPDCVVFLDLALEEAERRGGYGEEKYEKREMQTEVRRLFKLLREEGPEEKQDVVVVNAGGSVEEVSRLVLEAVQNNLDWVEAGRLGEEVRKIEKWESDLKDRASS